jgi:hypothetical protein
MVVSLPSVVVAFLLPHAETAAAPNVNVAAVATPLPRNLRREVSAAGKCFSGWRSSSSLTVKAAFLPREFVIRMFLEALRRSRVMVAWFDRARHVLGNKEAPLLCEQELMVH